MHFYDFIKDYPQILNNENNNANDNMNVDKLVEENKKLKDEIEQKNNEIEKLKSDIANYINENNNFKNEKKNLDIYQQENQKLKNLNDELSNRVKILENQNINLNNQDKNIQLMNELKGNDNNLNELNIAKDLIPVIFQTTDKKITYAIICRKTDKFNKIENIFYEIFPDLEETEELENIFKVKGKKVIKAKTLAQNNINYSDLVVLNKIKI